jgi:hypothetical protein
MAKQHITRLCLSPKSALQHLPALHFIPSSHRTHSMVLAPNTAAQHSALRPIPRPACLPSPEHVPSSHCTDSPSRHPTPPLIEPAVRRCPAPLVPLGTCDGEATHITSAPEPEISTLAAAAARSPLPLHGPATRHRCPMLPAHCKQLMWSVAVIKTIDIDVGAISWLFAVKYHSIISSPNEFFFLRNKATFKLLLRHLSSICINLFRHLFGSFFP